MSRALTTLFFLAALGLGAWVAMLKQQMTQIQDKQQSLQDQLSEKGEELTEAFAENRRLAMAQAGAVSELESAQARIRELEAEVEQVTQELKQAPSKKKTSDIAWNWGKGKHPKLAVEDMKMMFDAKMLGADKKRDEVPEIDQLKKVFSKNPLSKDQEAALRDLLDGEPDGNTQTVTQTDDGNGFTVVMTAVGGTDEGRDERIRKGAEEFLSEKQQSLLKSWQKKRGKRSFHSTKSFSFETK
jgi:hypothetical protein